MAEKWTSPRPARERLLRFQVTPLELNPECDFGLRRHGFNGFVDGLNDFEAQPAIEPDRRRVSGGDFEVDA